MKNIRAVKSVLHKTGTRLVIDACRFAENTHFIKHREPGYEITYQAPFLRHFTCYFEKLAKA